MDHCSQSSECFGKYTCSAAGCSGLYSRSEHFNGAYGSCSCNPRYRSSDKRGICIWNIIAYRTVRVGAERIIASEINDVSGYGHDKGRGEASPERSGPFMTRYLAEPIEGGGEISAACLVYCAIGR